MAQMGISLLIFIFSPLVIDISNLCVVCVLRERELLIASLILLLFFPVIRIK